MPILDNTLIQCDFCEFTFYREGAWCCTPKHVALNMKAQVAMRKPQPQLWACVKCVMKNPEVKKKYGGKFYFDVKWLKQREEPAINCEDCQEWIDDYLKEAFAIAEGTQEFQEIHHGGVAPMQNVQASNGSRGTDHDDEWRRSIQQR